MAAMTADFLTFLLGMFAMATKVFAAEIDFPDHVTVAMDESATFSCSLTLTEEEASMTHGIRWIRGETTVIVSSDVFHVVNSDTKYLLSGLSTSLQVTYINQKLLVTNVSESDLETYQCIFLLNNQETNTKASARLYINEYLPELMCSTSSETVVPNEQISLQCSSEPGDPEIQMTWSSEVDGNNLDSYTQSSNEQLNLNYILTVPNVNGMIVFTCQTSNGGNAKSCRVNLQVAPPHSLFIIQSPDPAVIGQNVTFTCLKKQGSTVSTLSWSYPSSVIATEDNGRLLIENVQVSYNGMVITCSGVEQDGQQIVMQIVFNVTDLVTTLTQQTTPAILQTSNRFMTRQSTVHKDSTATNDLVTTQTQQATPALVQTSNRITMTRQSTKHKDSTVTKGEISTNNTDTKSPKSTQEESSAISTMIIIVAVCGFIALLIIFSVFVFCCKSRSQSRSSEGDINSHMEYYKNVKITSKENEDVKQDTERNSINISFVANNFDESAYYNEGFEESKTYEIYYKDDGWIPPTSSTQTTTL